MANYQGKRIINNNVLRIVMVGRTGCGKSTTGNTILGRMEFVSKCSAQSVTSECSKQDCEVDGKQVSVIDTPGLFDTNRPHEKVSKDLDQCIQFAAPGPHIFLVIISLTRFTKEEKDTVTIIQKMFGKAADKYSMVLFTHGDNLEDTTIEEYIEGSPDLVELVRRCNDQFHVFNNRLSDKKPQVTALLEKIRTIVDRNGGSHYTNEMFQEAERAIKEERDRILKEMEEERRKEKEAMDKEIKKKFQQEMNEMEQHLKAEREREMKKFEEVKKMHEEKMRKAQLEMEEKDRNMKQVERDMIAKEKNLQIEKNRFEEEQPEREREKKKMEEEKKSDEMHEEQKSKPQLEMAEKDRNMEQMEPDMIGKEKNLQTEKNRFEEEEPEREREKKKMEEKERNMNNDQ